MALHDGLVNWPLFFGSILVGFGPLAALFFVVVAKRAQLVILALSGAFVWLVAILVTATLWQIIPPLKTSLSATVPVGVVVQEAFRLLFFYLYTRTELAVKRVTTSSHQLPLNDITSSLAGGVGFSVMHALLMFGSLVGSSTGSRGAAFSASCESILLVFGRHLHAGAHGAGRRAHGRCLRRLPQAVRAGRGRRLRHPHGRGPVGTVAVFLPAVDIGSLLLSDSLCADLLRSRRWPT